ncbi:quinol dehydrogenase ferredoxin subunit NapH [Nitratifractor salsuginis]|uniref:Periplasmic nitrate reductase subunit NapH n=1 Tax=Nitratifractor salsuginis (strain DSM 16511 / JCM 12458 / E9I37-1) TaxID=749222 RepID=E6X0K4_NITSE|nr:quinol dehydrogenase ferredoxin subunit NapH [Nitratifractor salsuginis]ADV46854.1 periplasmic nitrate reductase subunit NapH [Nitratifractor salsuginis DSM 16511]
MKWSNIKYLILRRIVQIGLLVLYFMGSWYGWKVLQGDLSTSLVLGKIPLSDPFAVLQIFATGAVVGVNVLIGAAIITLFYAIIGGRAFCSWVCPVNMITDLAAWLRRKLLIDRIERKIWISRNVRYYMIVLALIVSAVTGLAAFEIVSPITIFNRNVVFGIQVVEGSVGFALGAGIGLLVAIFLFDLFAVKNGWCGHICPLGGVYSVIGKYSLIRVKHNSDNCTLCMKCKNVCPEVEVLGMIGKRSEFVSKGECTNCGRCVDVCDDEALGFELRNFLAK